MSQISIRIGMLIVLAMALCGCKEQKLRNDWMASCTSDGTSVQMCKCNFDALKAHYGVDGLQGIKDVHVIPSDWEKVTVDSALECTISIGHLSEADAQRMRATLAAKRAQDARVRQMIGQADPSLPSPGPLPADANPQVSAAQAPMPSNAGQGDGAESNTFALGNHNLVVKRASSADPYVVTMDGKELKRVEAFSLKFEWSSGGGARPGYALLGVNSGGTACPLTYFLVEVSPEGATRVSPEFGSCSDQITSTETIPGGVVVKMPDFLGPSESAAAQEKAASRTKTYVWQEGSLKEQ